MTKTRYFKDSKGYFKFIKNKSKLINIIMVKPLKNTIRVDYINKIPEEREMINNG